MFTISEWLTRVTEDSAAATTMILILVILCATGFVSYLLVITLEFCLFHKDSNSPGTGKTGTRDHKLPLWHRALQWLKTLKG